MDPNENLDTRDEAHCILDVIQSYSFLAFSIFEWMSSGNLIPSKLFAAKMFVVAECASKMNAFVTFLRRNEAM